VRRILVLFLLPLALGAAPGASGDIPRLVGTVGPGFTIDLVDATGKHVDVIPAGQYELLVHDLSAEHNFVLGNRGSQALVAQTEGPFVGDQTFTINLTQGSYAYACSPHFEVMFGRFQVSAAPTPAQTTTSLTARVTSRAVSISSRDVTAGAFKLTVSDRSKTRNFHVVGPGVNKKTSKGFTGSVTWRLQLAAGTYRFGSDPRLTGRLVVRAAG
jgi:hypothetical protein